MEPQCKPEQEWVGQLLGILPYDNNNEKHNINTYNVNFFFIY